MTRTLVTAEVDEHFRISDEFWQRIAPLLPPDPPHPKGGRPWAPARPMMEGIFYVLRTGCQWKALPRCFGAPSTVHDRFLLWRQAGVFRKLWRAGLLEFEVDEGLDFEWQALDGAMTKAPLGGGEHRTEPHRPRQAGHQALLADGGTRAADRSGGGRGQPHRYETGAGDPGVHRGGTAAGDARAATAPLPGQRL